MLCDHAQAENGKLYILGGGWDQIAPARLPFRYPVSVAIKLVLPGERAVESVAVRIDILDTDGQPIGGESGLEGRIKGTPVGSAANEPGAPFPPATVFLALSTLMEIAQAGRFTVRLTVEDETIAETGFTVVAPPVGDEQVQIAEVVGYGE